MKRLLILLSVLMMAWPAVNVHADGQTPWDDEPNELSWECLSRDLRAAMLWQAWWDKQDVGLKQQALEAAREAGMLHLPAATQTDLIFQAEGATPTDRWKPAVYEGRRVLRGPAGHNTSPAQLVIDIPQAGTYRLWTRWFNQATHRSSLSIRVRPIEAQSQPYKWLMPESPDFVTYRAGFVPTKNRKTTPIIEEQLDQRGYHWTGSPLFELPRGQVIIEWSGMIHDGPYGPRFVDLFLLTQDPLYTPDAAATDLPDSQADNDASLATSRPRPTTGDLPTQQAWALRPGSQPLHTAPPVLAHLWQSFRHALIARLATAQDEAAAADLSHDEKYLSQLFYFDERWNLIGTPAQVATRVAELSSPQYRVQGFFQWIEAETLQVDAGWKVTDDTSASRGKTLLAHYANGRAAASTTLNIPTAGPYRLWVRYARIKPYHNTFEVTLTQQGQPPRVRKFHEQPPDDAPGSYRYVWEAFEVDLQAGACHLTLTKNIGKPPYAYRKVDGFVMTADMDWQPSDTTRPIIPSGQSQWFAWVSDQDDHWTGFGPTSRPTTPPAADSPIQIEVQPGAVAQRVVHISNDTEQPITLTPTIQGQLPANWRVVASQLHPTAGWQPMPLLRRHTVSVQPGLTGSLWVNFDARDVSPGRYKTELRFDDGRRVVHFDVHVAGVDIRQAPSPYVGGWMAPPHMPAGYDTMQDIGLTILHSRVISKAHMQRHGFKLMPLMLGKPGDAQRVHDVVAAIRSRGLDYADWAWVIADEPGAKTYAKWVAAARVIREADPKVRIWCNPGEIQSSNIEAVTAMAPFIDVFCPYINHFNARDEAYRKLLATTGDIKLLYTTPCFQEKTPAAPLALLGLARSALKHHRDGWNAFTLLGYYSYAASAWDEVSAPFPDQAVSFYPGAHRRIIGSRNLEAVRQAVAIYKTGRLQDGQAKAQ